jgi:hypothetical protein
MLLFIIIILIILIIIIIVVVVMFIFVIYFSCILKNIHIVEYLGLFESNRY